MTVKELVELAAVHDSRAQDVLEDLKAEDFRSTDIGQLTWRDVPLEGDAAWKSLCRVLGVEGDSLRESEPAIVRRMLRRLPRSTPVLVRQYRRPETVTVRAFLSSEYRPVKSKGLLKRLLTHEIKRSTDNLTVEAYEFTPDGMHVEIYDPETHSRTGDQEREIVHPGWLVRTRDVGDASAVTAPYLWHLICGNTLMVRREDVARQLRARFKPGWDGATIGIDVWETIIREASWTRFIIPEPAEVRALLGDSLDRLKGVPVDYFARRVHDVYYNCRIMMRPFTQWELAQAIGAFPHELVLKAEDRTDVQALAGRVLISDIREALPAFTPLLTRGRKSTSHAASTGRP